VEEIPLADGTVQIDIKFKAKQLSEGIEAEESDNVEINHLPLKKEVREEVDTTAEAKNITSADIVVDQPEKAEANVSAESISVTLDGLSVISASVKGGSNLTKVGASSHFVTKNGTLSNIYTGSNQLSKSDIYDVLKVNRLNDFAVVSNNLITNDHIEGNIRVSNWTVGANGAQLNNGQRLLVNNDVTSITVNKTVVYGKDDTFQFGFYDSEGTKVGNSINITTSGGKGSIELTPISDYQAIYNAINEEGKQLSLKEEGARNSNPKEWSVDYSYGSSGSAIAASNLDHYIGAFTGTLFGADTSIFGDDSLTKTVYVGQKPTLYENNHTRIGDKFQINNKKPEDLAYLIKYVPNLQSTIQSDMERVKTLSTTIAQAKHGDTGTTGADINVINLEATSGGNIQQDLENAGFNLGSEGHAGVVEGFHRL